MIEFLKRLFGLSKPAASRNQPSGSAPRRPAAAPGRSSAPAPKPQGARERWAEAAAKSIDATASPEALCGITEGMSPLEIDQRLAELHRRHNRAATSLDAKLREEAAIMLDAIAAVKEKLPPS